MENLLTVRQVQEILKVDRITIYRMLHDNRIKGVKIGQQWRFTLTEVERLVNGEEAKIEADPALESSLPVHCIQTIQDLFSAVSQVSAMMVDPNGERLTEISRPCAFCQQVMSSAAGADACRLSWQQITRECDSTNRRSRCHAGLDYIVSPVKDKESVAGAFLIGQFLSLNGSAEMTTGRVSQLARSLNLDEFTLMETVSSIPTLSDIGVAQVEAWGVSAERAVESILQERAGYLTRLRQIADLTQII